MKHIFSQLEKTFPFIHERSATEQDFFEYCQRHKITVVFDRDISNGLYVRFMDMNTIFLNPKLKGWMLLYVMFHELAHAMFQVPTQSNAVIDFFGVEGTNNRKRKNHIEAEAVAAFLLLPTMELHERLTDPEFEHNESLQKLVGYRLELFSKHKK